LIGRRVTLLYLEFSFLWNSLESKTSFTLHIGSITWNSLPADILLSNSESSFQTSSNTCFYAAWLTPSPAPLRLWRFRLWSCM